jgi:2',3'-cyclic-nucleotide 2'-phosphodiesterase (5'-nucleotidase family)
MRQRALNLGVDLIMVDTGDLHDGAGLSDATSPNGLLNNPLFEEIDYDVLTIGNHELYLSDIAYLTADSFAKYYGDKYVSSNVQIYDKSIGQYKDISNKYRYFTTHHGLNVMAFGVLFDFTGNSNASKVTPAATMVKQQWFIDAVNFDKPIDMFLLIGHNPVRRADRSSTLGTVLDEIRKYRPDVPVQVFGGHSHIRDFTVYDSGATGLESGRYCETLGWVSISGIKSPTYRGLQKPFGVPNPTKKAVVPAATGTAVPVSTPTPAAFQDLVYSRRYLDWNRRTFAYHAVGSQSETFDYHSGLRVSAKITETRKQLNLTTLFGCVPQTYCVSCVPFGSPNSIFTVLTTALATVVVNATRASTPRLVFINTGSVRFDLNQGPLTLDDSFTVSPFHDTFQYLPNVPYAQAKQILSIINGASFGKRDAIPVEPRAHELSRKDLGFTALTGEECVDASVGAHEDTIRRRNSDMTRGTILRRADTLAPGYTTTDDFGTDGDDTVHSAIPFYSIPGNIQAQSFTGPDPANVDVVFLDYIARDVLAALKQVGATYTTADVQQYLDPSFDTNTYIPAYAKVAWQAGVPNCPIGKGSGI